MFKIVDLVKQKEDLQMVILETDTEEVFTRSLSELITTIKQSGVEVIPLVVFIPGIVSVSDKWFSNEKGRIEYENVEDNITSIEIEKVLYKTLVEYGIIQFSFNEDLNGNKDCVNTLISLLNNTLSKVSERTGYYWLKSLGFSCENNILEYDISNEFISGTVDLYISSNGRNLKVISTKLNFVEVLYLCRVFEESGKLNIPIGYIESIKLHCDSYNTRFISNEKYACNTYSEFEDFLSYFNIDTEESFKEVKIKVSEYINTLLKGKATDEKLLKTFLSEKVIKWVMYYNLLTDDLCFNGIDARWHKEISNMVNMHLNKR